MIANAAAAFALLLAQANAAPARPCVTTAELGDLAVVALPEVVEGFAAGCSVHLPASAYLRSGASGFTQRLRADGAARRGTALAAVARVAPPHMRAQIGTEAGLKMVIGVLGAPVTRRLNPTTCAELSRFVENLSPLPVDNIAALVSSAAAFRMAMRPPQQGSQGGPPICAS